DVCPWGGHSRPLVVVVRTPASDPGQAIVSKVCRVDVLVGVVRPAVHDGERQHARDLIPLVRFRSSCRFHALLGNVSESGKERRQRISAFVSVDVDAHTTASGRALDGTVYDGKGVAATVTVVREADVLRLVAAITGAHGNVGREAEDFV